MIRVRIPQVVDLEGAIKMYYRRIELSNADIETLFGKHSSSTIAKLKKMAQNKMVENNVMSLNALYVNTAAAYEAWGLDINDLEHRFQKLKQLA